MGKLGVGLACLCARWVGADFVASEENPDLSSGASAFAAALSSIALDVACSTPSRVPPVSGRTDCCCSVLAVAEAAAQAAWQ